MQIFKHYIIHRVLISFENQNFSISQNLNWIVKMNISSIGSSEKSQSIAIEEEKKLFIELLPTFIS